MPASVSWPRIRKTPTARAGDLGHERTVRPLGRGAQPSDHLPPRKAADSWALVAAFWIGDHGPGGLSLLAPARSARLPLVLMPTGWRRASPIFYIMLSRDYEATYDRMLQNLGGRCADLRDSVCLHWPMHQPTFTHRLLVVGQALNGWTVEGPECGLSDAPVRAPLLDYTRRCSEAANAFCWMSPRVWSRPFWKLARVAMDAYGLSREEIAWSNLAKVAPAAGKNPNRELLWRQHELGGRLLRQEVEELDPDLVLIVSDRGYAEPFLSGAGLSPAWQRRGALQFDGMMGGHGWLVVSHPGTFAHRYESSRAALAGALHEA